MELGQFSVSLAVQHMHKSKAFYEALGFKALEGGAVQDNWLIMQNGSTVIGLFKDMFEHNILTFNPSDARAIQQHMSAAGIKPVKSIESDSGPCHCVYVDPDGNQIMFDQH